MNHKNIKVIFMGTPDFAVPVLREMLENFNVVGVITQPDRAVGRQFDVQSPPVKMLAQQFNIPVFQPEILKENELLFNELKNLQPDVIAVAAYGKILPREIINLPPHGCLNVHPSFLPKYRGASPIQTALLNGEKEIGLSIMLMDLGLDTGDVLAQKKIEVMPEDDAGALHNKLAQIGAGLMVQVIPEYLKDNISLKIQDETQATFCKMIKKEDGKVYWMNSAAMIHNKIRAFSPWPGAFCFWDDKRLILNKAKIVQEKMDNYQVGQVFRAEDGEICVKTGRDYLVLEEVQLEGRKKVGIKNFVNGYPRFVGTVLR